MPDSYPFKTNNLDGLVTDLISKSLFDSNVDTAIIPLFSIYYASKCFDRLSNTFCHTKDAVTDEKYLWVHIKYSPFYLEGYAFQSRSCCNNPRNWTLKGSNDNINFYSIDSRYSNDQCYTTNILSYHAISIHSYSYFKVVFHGKSCGNTDSINIAEFELFGSFHQQVEQISEYSYKPGPSFLLSFPILSILIPILHISKITPS